MKKIATKRVSNAFMIGLFVIVSTVVLIGAVIWLGANKFFKENIYFVTYFDGSIEGLENGSAVKYQGVPVGSVSKIELAPDGKLVQVTMQIKRKIDLRDNMRVKLEWAASPAENSYNCIFGQKRPPLEASAPQFHSGISGDSVRPVGIRPDGRPRKRNYGKCKRNRFRSTLYRRVRDDKRSRRIYSKQATI